MHIHKINNRNTSKSEICSKLTLKAPERGQLCRSGVFNVSFEHISSSVSIVDFEHVFNCWVTYKNCGIDT